MAEHKYEGRGDKSRLPDYGEKAACSPRQIPEPSGQSSSPQSQKFQGGRMSSMAAVKFRDLPAHEIRIQCLVNRRNGGHCAPSISNRDQKGTENNLSRSTRPAPTPFDAVHDM